MERHVHRAAPGDPAGGEARVTLLVFGRTEYAEPLVELGTLPDDGEVLEAYDGEWVELVAFPEDDVRWIIRGGEDVNDD